MRDSQTDLELWPGETQSECDRIRAEWQSAYDLSKPGVTLLVECLIEADRLQRYSIRRLRDTEHTVVAAQLLGDEKELKAARKAAEFAMRSQSNAERSFQRALRTLEQVVARRFREEITTRTVETREVHMALNMQFRAFLADFPDGLFEKWIAAVGGPKPPESNE